MRKIVMENRYNTIKFSDVDESTPIFAEKDGILTGMIVKEAEEWILRTGGDTVASRGYSTLRECIVNCQSIGFEFFVR